MEKKAAFQPVFRNASGTPVGVMPAPIGRDRGRFRVYALRENRFLPLRYADLPAQDRPEDMLALLRAFGARQKKWAPIEETADVGKTPKRKYPELHEPTKKNADGRQF